jgi:hypothetical protein
MNITSKSVHTLKLQRDSIDKCIRENTADMFQDLFKDKNGSTRDLLEHLQSSKTLVQDAVNGNYSKIFAEGNTYLCLTSEEINFVENFFDNKGDNEELVIEVYDEECFIDRVKENEINF